MQYLTGPIMYPRLLSDAVDASSSTTFTLNATGRAVGGVFTIPKTGTITALWWRTYTVTTAGTLTVGLETVSGQFPTGVPYGGSSTETLSSQTSNTLYRVPLATPATAVKGDKVALTIRATSAINLIVAVRGAAAGNFPYTVSYDPSTSTWTAAKNRLMMALEYSDGTVPYIDQTIVYASSWSASYNSGSAFNEYALCFTLPFTAEVSGFWRFSYSIGSGTYDVKLYDSASSVLATKSFIDNVDAVGIYFTGFYRFDNPVVVQANQIYRLGIVATSTTNISVSGIDVGSTNGILMGSMEGGSAFYLSKRANNGAWTDVTTSIPSIGLLISGIDTSAGGGSLYIPQHVVID